MEYEIRFDGNQQPYIEWCQAKDPSGKLHLKRAWIRRSSAENDWASSGRYLHVARVDNGKVNASPDFPILSDLSSEQLLLTFVASLNILTGCVPPETLDADRQAAS